MRPSVQVSIEELMLHGFAAADRHRIGEALERELARLLAAESLPASMAQGGDISVLDGGSIQIAAGLQPERIGAQIARAVHSGLNPGQSGPSGPRQ